MTLHLALLGSINVGGNRIKMDELRQALGRAGLANVSTVVASGNVLFEPDGCSAQETERRIAEVLEKDFGLHCMVTVRSLGEVREAVARNPFHGDGEDKFVHSQFLETQPTQKQFSKLVEDHEGRGSERLALGERVLFIDYDDGAGNSKLTGSFIERRLETRGTARNMSSLKRIIAKMEEHA